MVGMRVGNHHRGESSHTFTAEKRDHDPASRVVMIPTGAGIDHHPMPAGVRSTAPSP